MPPHRLRQVMSIGNASSDREYEYCWDKQTYKHYDFIHIKKEKLKTEGTTTFMY